MATALSILSKIHYHNKTLISDSVSNVATTARDIIP